MKNEMEEGIVEHTGQSVICPRCHRVHYSRTAIMDEYIDCSCGLSFYAFSCKGLRIIMPANEAGCESVARAMRKFVVSTGRCTDIPPALYQDEDGQLCFGFLKQSLDIDEQLEIGLERYQSEYFGECYLTKEMVYTICESFKNGIDVELRKQKKGVDIIKLIKKKIASPEKKYRQITDAEKRSLPQLVIPNNGIMMQLQTKEDQYTAFRS